MKNCKHSDALVKGSARFSRRKLLGLMSGLPLLWAGLSATGYALGEAPGAIPSDLDEPTAWREGDPEPVELSVPPTEPEQSSYEAPPAQPMNDDRGVAPGLDYQWVYGYWWWSGPHYIWVPGYWSIPPNRDYIYIPGRWSYASNAWFYVRGGWGFRNTLRVLVYAAPRPYRRVYTVAAPHRIVRRYYGWPYYPARSRRYYQHQSLHRNLRPGKHSPKREGRNRIDRGPS